MAEAADKRKQSAASAPGSLVERLRQGHLRMGDAALGGDGLAQVAALAAEAAGAPVAIVVPRLDAAAAAGGGDAALEAIRRYVGDRVGDRPSQGPGGLAAGGAVP